MLIRISCEEMENSNAKADADTAARADVEQNPTNNPPNAGDAAANRRQRTPFTDLSQVDADLALARTLQEQVFLLRVFLFPFGYYQFRFKLCGD